MFTTDSDSTPVALQLVAKADLDAWRGDLPPAARNWLDSTRFAAKAGEFAWLPNAAGEPASIAVGAGDGAGLYTLGGLPFALPEGDYALPQQLDHNLRSKLILGWGLGAYRYDRYKERPGQAARLVIDAAEQATADALLGGVNLCRQLINTPTSDLLPHHLEDEVATLADRHGATLEVTRGDALLDAGMRTIHAVGRASVSEPRLLDLRWGDPARPKVTLVGKGVCFDSGGLNIKPSGPMRLMKKDMGGAAHVLGLADVIMTERLPISLRVLVSAVENAISGNAFRPGDVLTSYKGLTIEIDNTDAEGRLILCDALALAAEDKPELIVDFATLTGSARSALGTELPAMFANRDEVADGIYAAGQRAEDAVWRMPLHQPYKSMLDSSIADLVNAAASPYAGAIVAGLFLEAFVDDMPWVHFDVMAWNVKAKPGRPEGGEAMGMRAVYAYLTERFDR